VGTLLCTSSWRHGVQAEKARCNVWQWLTLNQAIVMPDGSREAMTVAVLDRAMEEVFALATGEERPMWGKVCKGVAPMQPDELADKHFVVARRIQEILITNDRCIEFIPDLAYPFLLEPVRRDEALWQRLYDNLELYRDPMTKFDAEIRRLQAQLGQ
jgi:hypothetical protein